LKRAHLWPAIAAPILAFGWWERTLGPLLPFVVPAALFALRRASWQRTTLFVAGSLWITAVVGSLTVGGTATTIAHKLALVSPGLLLAAATLVPEYLDVGRARLGTEPVPATGTPQAEIVSPRRGAGRAP
jgi:hypothetical protein